MHDAVKDGFSKRAVVATELVVPSAGIVLGAEDRGGFLPSSVEQFQDVMLFRFRRLQSPPPVKRVARDAGYKPALLGCASRRWLSLSAMRILFTQPSHSSVQAILLLTRRYPLRGIVTTWH